MPDKTYTHRLLQVKLDREMDGCQCEMQGLSCETKRVSTSKARLDLETKRGSTEMRAQLWNGLLS